MENCHYSVIRYVPDDLRDESVNIGVIIQNDAENRCLAEFSSNLVRASSIDPALERESVEQIVRLSERRLQELCKKHNLSEIVGFHSSGRIRLTQPRFCRADDVQDELKQLTESFIVSDSAQRVLGQTERRLVRNVKEDLKARISRLPERVISFRKKNSPILYEGKTGQHYFDIAFHSPFETDLIRCISFDVKADAEKVNEAKVLSFDARDIWEAHKDARVKVLAVVLPPQRIQNGNLAAFQLASRILDDSEIPTYDFSLQSGREGLAKVAQSRIAEASSPAR